MSRPRLVLFSLHSVFILSGCASAISRQHHFEVIQSSTNLRDCQIQEWPRRAVIKSKKGTVNVIVMNSGRATWVGIPLIPFIPTFADGDLLSSLRVDATLTDERGESIPGIPAEGWILHLNGRDIEGKAEVHQYWEKSVKQVYSTTIHFNFDPVTVNEISFTVPSFTVEEKPVLVKLEHHLKSEYFGFAYGLTHYSSSLCPESPRQAVHHVP